MTDLDVTTALALILPPEYHEKINSIRKDNDRAYPRWMPHINFLFPFISLENFDEYHNKLQTALKGFGSFELTFDKIGYFKQKKAATFNLQLSNDTKIQELFDLIRITIPEIEPKHPEFHPHLTLGQSKKSMIDQTMIDLENWLGLGMTIQVNKIYMINRSKNNKNIPYTINREITLI